MSQSAPARHDGESASGGLPGLPPDWPQRATDKVVTTVDQIRTKSSGPAIDIARKVVYGIVAALLAIIALIVAIIGLIRVLDVYIPSGVWVPYLILGSLFTAGGLFLWSRRPKGAATPIRGR